MLELWLRQAGSAQPDRSFPMFRSEFTQSGFGLFEKIVGTGGVVRLIPAPGTGGEEPQVLRRNERLGAQPKAMQGLATSRARAANSAGRLPRTTGPTRWPRCSTSWALARTMAASCRWQGRTGRKAGRRSAHPRRRAAGPDRQGRASSCAGSSISRSMNGTRRTRRSNSATTRSRCRRAGWTRCAIGRTR